MKFKFSPFHILSLILILLYAAIIFIGIYVPLQTDEIAWQYVNSRAITDHFQLITLLPQCQPAASFAKKLPLLWYPHAWVNHFIFMYIDDPLWIKITGILRFVLFLAVSWFITKPLAPYLKTGPRTLFLIFLAILGLDELPFLLQVARPEQTILLSVGIFAALALNAGTISLSAYLKYSAAILFLFTALLLFPAHPKAVAALPITMFCAWVLFYRLSGKRLHASIITAVILGFALFSVRLWLERYACPSSILSKIAIDANSPALDKLFSNPALFFHDLFHNFLLGIVYDFNIHLHIITRDNWLPPSLAPMPGWLTGLNYNFMIFLLCLRAALLMFCGIFTVVTIIRATIACARPSRPIALAAKMGGFIFITIICLMLTSSTRLFYFVPLQLPLLILSAMMMFSSLKIPRFAVKLWPYVKYALLVLAIGNMALLVYKYNPYIFHPGSRQSVIGNSEMGKREIMLSPLDYNSRNAAIMRAYNMCSLPPVKKAGHLILDDYTYTSLRHSFEPLAFDYVTDIFHFGQAVYGNKEFLDFINLYSADGVVLNCEYVPPALRPYLLEHDGYCCATAARLNLLIEKP